MSCKKLTVTLDDLTFFHARLSDGDVIKFPAGNLMRLVVRVRNRRLGHKHHLTRGHMRWI